MIQRRVITAKEEERHLPIQWKVTERSMIPRRVITAKEEERHLPIQWKVTDDSEARGRVLLRRRRGGILATGLAHERRVII